jgi:hypothetical protein
VDLNGATIRNNAGNDAGLTFTPPNTSGVLVDAGDTVAPTIGSVTPPANGHYVTGQVLDILVKFSEPVNVGTSGSARPYLRLRIASVIRNATFSVGAVGASPGLAPTRPTGLRDVRLMWCVAQGGWCLRAGGNVTVGAVGASPRLAPTRCPIQRNNKGESGTRPYKTYGTAEPRNWPWRGCVAQGV